MARHGSTLPFAAQFDAMRLRSTSSELPVFQADPQTRQIRLLSNDHMRMFSGGLSELAASSYNQHHLTYTNPNVAKGRLFSADIGEFNTTNMKGKKRKMKTKLSHLQKVVLTSEFKRDPVWSSLKIRRVARFLMMKPTQVYKWNWNRKRARFDLADNSTKRLKDFVSQMKAGEDEEEKHSPSSMEEFPDKLKGPGHQVSKNRMELLEALADFEDEHFMQRSKRFSDKDDIIIFKVQKNAPREPLDLSSKVRRHHNTPNGINKSTLKTK